MQTSGARLYTCGLARRLCGAMSLAVFAGAMALPGAGCFNWSSISTTEGEDTEVAVVEGTTGDSFAMALAEAEPEEQPYLELARPFFEAIVQRDYAAAFSHLGPKARARMTRNQFITPEDEQEAARYEAEALENPTAEQFAELMREVEKHYGTPRRLEHIYAVTDAEVLSGQDPVLAAYEIGSLPDSIPIASRKAAVQAWVQYALLDSPVGDQPAPGTAKDSGPLPPDYEGPYFKVRTVIVDEGAGPSIGYFEIAPPSIWD